MAYCFNFRNTRFRWSQIVNNTSLKNTSTWSIDDVYIGRDCRPPRLGHDDEHGDDMTGCWGRGLCTFEGCECEKGYSGVNCEDVDQLLVRNLNFLLYLNLEF